MLAETDDAGTVQRNYVYGYGLVERIGSAGGASYYHFDPTGSTLALSNAAGAVTDSYAYTPYGETTASGTTVNPFRYVGKLGVMDDGNGMQYMRARYYRPDVARFMSLDQLAGSASRPQSLNRYAYALGNPVMGVDPSGLEDEDINQTEATKSSVKFLLADNFVKVKSKSVIYKNVKKNVPRSIRKKLIASGKSLSGFKKTELITTSNHKAFDGVIGKGTEKWGSRLLSAGDSFETGSDYLNGNINLAAATAETVLTWGPGSELNDAFSMGFTAANVVTNGAFPADANKTLIRGALDKHYAAQKGREGISYLNSVGVETECITNPSSCGMSDWQADLLLFGASIGMKEWQ